MARGNSCWLWTGIRPCIHIGDNNRNNRKSLATELGFCAGQLIYTSVYWAVRRATDVWGLAHFDRQNERIKLWGTQWTLISGQSQQSFSLWDLMGPVDLKGWTQFVTCEHVFYKKERKKIVWEHSADTELLWHQNISKKSLKAPTGHLHQNIRCRRMICFKLLGSLLLDDAIKCTKHSQKPTTLTRIRFQPTSVQWPKSVKAPNDKKSVLNISSLNISSIRWWE